MSVLSLNGVSLSRVGARVLDKVSATFAPGKLTAVIGPNGAGKSTLLAVAAGVLSPDEGSVTLDARPLGEIGRRALACRRAYLPQSPRVDWPISVERVVALGLTPSLPAFGNLPLARQEQVERALEAYDLGALRHRPATMLSGGELARVMLARATVGDPQILIVDEPTAGLDPRHGIDAVARLRRHADQGRTVVMAIHDLDLAVRAADEVVAVHGGRIFATGRTENVLTAALLEQLFNVRARVTWEKEGGAVRFLD